MRGCGEVGENLSEGDHRGPQTMLQNTVFEGLALIGRKTNFREDVHGAVDAQV